MDLRGHRIVQVVILHRFQRELSLCEAWKLVADKLWESVVHRGVMHLLRLVACFFFNHDAIAVKPAQNIDLKLVVGASFPGLSDFFCLPNRR